MKFEDLKVDILYVADYDGHYLYFIPRKLLRGQFWSISMIDHQKNVVSSMLHIDVFMKATSVRKATKKEITTLSLKGLL